MSRSDARPTLVELANSFQRVRKYSLDLVSPLSEEDMQLQSMPDASPSKWHLAHTSWAFETFILKPYFPNYQDFDPSFEYLFNSYYNAVGEQFSRLKRGLLSRPNLATVLNYRLHVNEHMQTLLNKENDENHSLINLVQLMTNHEQQHQELLLTDVKHALFINPAYPAYQKAKQPNYHPHPMTWTSIESGIHHIGHANETFYFDNEGPKHKVYVEEFELANRLVTCGEYIEFIENGGYQESSFWLSEAWYQLKEKNTLAPLYWVKKEDKWFHYTLSGLIPVDLNAPVTHTNYFEANAYAASINKRLPTEHEWEVAARIVTKQLREASPTQAPNGCLGSGLQQMFGELWQWTSSSYNAYPGFKISEGATGEYNGKFMVNQYVLRGGSFVTPKGHIRPSYRNFFYPGASWQFSGIRLAANA
ncbi:MAG: ergothioneine biosynthesis protein EgtB [Kangiellaceae bacterium]|nr:ergothioneine biosynthesis protein EgtB [Kangiellaceae bacterium]